jgi:hypothetical protein
VDARSANSVGDLRALDAKFLGVAVYAPCAPEARQRWVFVHTTCQIVPPSGNASTAKAALQEAFHAWAREEPPAA